MTYISAQLRTNVIEQAGGCCEYCRVSQEFSDIRFHVEHIIASVHGGKTAENNLALSCPRCNLYKGTNIAAADPLTDEPTFLFHPRRHKWSDHFRFNGSTVEPLTPEGRATEFVLRVNDHERLEQRQLLLTLESYPCPP
jgi:hypothetical protein